MDAAAVLQAQIRALSDLYSRIQGLRQIPATLLNRPISNSPFPPQSVQAEFQLVKGMRDILLSGLIQQSLMGAERRIEADGTQLDINYRRENRRRRRPASPESPKPYFDVDRKRGSPIRSMDDDGVQLLRPEDIISYAREFNQTQKTCRLHIWERTREGPHQQRSRILRFTIPDIITAYITLGYGAGDNAVVVQTLTAFGPREKKAPHSQSDFTVYRQVSQEIAKKLQTEVRVSLHELVKLLCSYEGLFIDRCVMCGRVLSAERHVPPVVRVGQPRHVNCQEE